MALRMAAFAIVTASFIPPSLGQPPVSISCDASLVAHLSKITSPAQLENEPFAIRLSEKAATLADTQKTLEQTHSALSITNRYENDTAEFGRNLRRLEGIASAIDVVKREQERLGICLDLVVRKTRQ